MMKAGLAIARAWILLVLAAGCAKRTNPWSDNRQQALASRIVFSQLDRLPTRGHPSRALEVSP